MNKAMYDADWHLKSSSMMPLQRQQGALKRQAGPVNDRLMPMTDSVVRIASARFNATAAMVAGMTQVSSLDPSQHCQE